jgi:hypothetical protein
MKIPLQRPLLIAGKSESSLDIREDVTAGDIWDFRLPARVDASGKAQFEMPETGEVLKVAARLAGIPEETIKRLTVADAMEVYLRVLPLCTAGFPLAGSAASASSSSTAA